MMNNIPISQPIIAKNAKKYILECLESGWVSSRGPYVEKFEQAFADYVGTKYAVATSSGTHALHLSLATLNIGSGDEVVVPTLTMIAAALPIIYVGATLVLVDSDTQTGNINPSLIESKITKKTKAIIVVHLNGHPAQMLPILSIARRHNLSIIEDAAESHGAKYKTTVGWKRVGSISDIGCFSFYGNKIITCGEGGMAVTNNKKLASRMRSLRNLARTRGTHFYHQEIGFTYRMSSLQAALGLAQLEQADKIIRLKERLATIYMDQLKNIPELTLPPQLPYAKRIFWNFDILLKNNKTRDNLAGNLASHEVESRNFVTPLHMQPAFLKLGLFKGEKYPVAEKLSSQGLSLPLGPDITKKDINYICALMTKILRS